MNRQPKPAQRSTPFTRPSRIVHAGLAPFHSHTGLNNSISHPGPLVDSRELGLLQHRQGRDLVDRKKAGCL